MIRYRYSFKAVINFCNMLNCASYFRFVQSFVSSEIQPSVKDFWIGLSLENSKLTWIDGHTFQYSHFEKNFKRKAFNPFFLLRTAYVFHMFWVFCGNSLYKKANFCMFSNKGFHYSISLTND